MFIGRQQELATLNRLYASDKFEFAVIYGRRRVGKTALISHFIKDKPAIYFMGVESNAKQNLDNFSHNIMEFATGININTAFKSFQDSLEYVFQLSISKRIILAIDEYPYVARASRSLASTLQMLIDKYKDTSKLMLILCGSSMSYMEDHVLAYKAPLYGRRTAQLKIHPFSFAEVCSYLTNFSPIDKAIAYGMVGGTPQYLLQLNDKLSIEENIKNIFLNPNSSLFEEPENLLKQEVREASLYNAIITAIATGSSRLSEISSKVGEDSNVCASYLKNLLALGIVKRETPYGEKISRKSIYAISDNMFRFWYRFIPANISLISRGAQELAYKRIEPFLADYMGRVFEDICQQYLWQLLLNNNAPIYFTDLGRWWGADKQLHKQTEIDIMAIQDKDTALFGECKWTNEKVDVGVLELLQHRSSLFNYSQTVLYIFSKSGFTKSCQQAASQSGNVKLVTYNEILQTLLA